MLHRRYFACGFVVFHGTGHLGRTEQSIMAALQILRIVSMLDMAVLLAIHEMSSVERILKMPNVLLPQFHLFPLIILILHMLVLSLMAVEPNPHPWSAYCLFFLQIVLMSGLQDQVVGLVIIPLLRVEPLRHEIRIAPQERVAQLMAIIHQEYCIEWKSLHIISTTNSNNPPPSNKNHLQGQHLVSQAEDVAVIIKFSMSSHEALSMMSNTSYCFSSANRHSHYNRQKTLFEKNLTHLEPKRELKISHHVQMIAEMFSALAHNESARNTAHSKRRRSLVG